MATGVLLKAAPGDSYYLSFALAWLGRASWLA